MSERPEEPEDFSPPSEFSPFEELDDPNGEADLGEPVQVQVEGIFLAESESAPQQRYVVLSDGERKLPITIGAFEAMSIGMALEGNYPDRPLTHDLIRNLLERLDGQVTRVVIDDVWSKTYYAKLFIKNGKSEHQIDCRPSDAIAVALRTEAPIFVRDGILEHPPE